MLEPAEEGLDNVWWSGYSAGKVEGMEAAVAVLHELGYAESAAALHRMNEHYIVRVDHEDDAEDGER